MAGTPICHNFLLLVWQIIILISQLIERKEISFDD